MHPLLEPHLLITDDDRDFRETLRDAFSAQGFRTSTAADGHQALECVRRSDVHLVMMDLQMPGLSGLETMRLAMAESVWRPFILVSGALTSDVVNEAKAMSAYSVLSKPISIRTISHTVHRALYELYQWEREHRG